MDFSEVDDDIESTLAGMREGVFTVVVSYVLRQPGNNAQHFMMKNLGSRTVTIGGDLTAATAAREVEEQIEEHLESVHGFKPWAIWTTEIFLGRPATARVPSLEFAV